MGGGIPFGGWGCGGPGTGLIYKYKYKYLDIYIYMYKYKYIYILCTYVYYIYVRYTHKYIYIYNLYVIHIYDPPWNYLYKIGNLGVRFYRDEVGRPVFTIEWYLDCAHPVWGKKNISKSDTKLEVLQTQFSIL